MQLSPATVKHAPNSPRDVEIDLLCDVPECGPVTMEPDRHSLVLQAAL